MMRRAVSLAAVSFTALWVGVAAALTATTVDYDHYKIEKSPRAVLMTFAQGADTRAFAWQTDTSVSESKVWLVKGATATDAAFDRATPFVGTSTRVTQPTLNCHKVQVTGLEPGATYAYRLGGGGRYAYGSFTCRKPGREVTIVNFNDPQTQVANLLCVWENTASRAAALVGAENVDFLLTGGDICDENRFTGISNPTYGSFEGSRLNNYVKWAFGVEAGAPHFPGVPWVMASGNHDYYLYGNATADSYAAYTTVSGASVGCRSFDYGDVHVATLPYQTWGQAFKDAIKWLDGDLRAAGGAKWKVVALHWGPYTTGDHFRDVATTKDLIKALTPVCSANHVDLVLQAHDHTYSKSLPYRWDAAGYTTSATDGTVVNLNPETRVINGMTCDVNPNGTYYVSCGCAGHRVGEGVAYAEATGSKSYTGATYKIATGKIRIDSARGKAGDNASHDLDASMFGVLRFTGDTMTYDFYVVETNGVTAPIHYDTLKVVKGKVDAFRVTPYVQNPTRNAMTVKWFTEGDSPATISWWTDGGAVRTLTTTPEEAKELFYTDQDRASYNSRTGYSGIERGPIQSIPWHHRVRLTGLKTGTRYHYKVELAGGATYANTFRTAPEMDAPVRFICYSDSETEPESTGNYETWEKPPNGSSYHPSKYFVDSTVGYASNIVHMIRRQPDFYLIAGDLVQYGAEQRDWDEFWRHNAGVRNDPAGSAAIFASPGNHDYLSTAINGSQLAAYDGGEAAISRYLRYFEFPSNGVDFKDGGKDRSQLFYRVDYGRVTVISIDTNNGDDSDMERDSCLRFYRAGAKLPAGHQPTANQQPCRAPDFNPGTPQFIWLTNQLAKVQAKGQFTFVFNHHMPHSVGYHNRHNVWSTTSYQEPYSAVAVRVLQPYLIKYGVTAWICGHDEILEHSQVTGTETLPNGTTREATLNIYDVGNSGDGLRGGGKAGEGYRGEANPYEHWRAHVDAPEIYDSKGVLTDGGKHYGHLEVNVEPDGTTGEWKCTLTPVYIFVNQVNGKAATFERREFKDVIVVRKTPPRLPRGMNIRLL